MMPYAKNGYWEYLPPGYGDGTRRPLLTFWHGIGENGAGTAGAELNKVLAHGPPKLIQNNLWTSDRPFIVLSPQHTGTDCPSADEVHDFITFAMLNYDVDPTRVYLTGLSCGARGSWAYLGKYKGEQVVAAALIAGDSSVAYNAAGCSLLATVGIWCFHGGADSPAADAAGMAKFMACPMPRKDAKYDEFPGVDHQGSWERVYDDPARLNMVLAWMLGQTK
jgi:predicted peptidase